jgi:hypothetical protein
MLELEGPIPKEKIPGIFQKKIINKIRWIFFKKYILYMDNLIFVNKFINKKKKHYMYIIRNMYNTREFIVKKNFFFFY